MFDKATTFIKKTFHDKSFIPLHEPCFIGKEKDYLASCINSSFVSYVGEYVNKFESRIAEYTGVKYAAAVVNGTEALHLALLVAGVRPGDAVITQPLSFVATVNAIRYCNADPVFVDVDRETLGLSPTSLERFLKEQTSLRSDGYCYHTRTGKRISVCVPVHVFGHAAKVDKIVSICEEHNICVVEDAAEALGSKYNGNHLGTFGILGIFSFNGNKIITCGGGGVVVSNNKELIDQVKHLSTTAKIPHKWHYVHDDVGYNYRLPNINAALGCAQMEHLDFFLQNKRLLADTYQKEFEKMGICFFVEPDKSTSNYWLNTLILNNKEERDTFLQESNSQGIMTRPAWTLLNKLEMYRNSHGSSLTNALWLEDRIVNIPSSVRIIDV